MSNRRQQEPYVFEATVTPIDSASPLPRTALRRSLPDPNTQSRFYLWSKRVLDLCMGVIIGICVLPIIVVVCAAVRVVDPGPVFYFHRRIGLYGRNINVLKIRSMYIDSEKILKEHIRKRGIQEEWEKYFKLRDDPRVLPVLGSFIRRYSIDELPQLWNIIRGDMSLVGPRPFPHYHLKNFNPEVQKMRASVLPGLTGLWQVSSRSDGDIHVQQELDLFYVKNQTTWLDFSILLRTIPAVLSGKGAR